MDKPQGSGIQTKEVFEFLSIDKKITEKEISEFLKDSNYSE